MNLICPYLIIATPNLSIEEVLSSVRIDKNWPKSAVHAVSCELDQYERIGNEAASFQKRGAYFFFGFRRILPQGFVCVFCLPCALVSLCAIVLGRSTSPGAPGGLHMRGILPLAQPNPSSLAEPFASRGSPVSGLAWRSPAQMLIDLRTSHFVCAF